MKKRIVLGGITGKMGSFLLPGLKTHPNFEVVAGLSQKENLSENIPIYSDPKKLLEQIEFDIYLDFTTYEFSMPVCEMMLEKGKPIVIGTTGFTKEDLDHLQKLARKTNTCGVIAPNFSLGILLLHQFSKAATKFFKNFAIYEYHHLTKHDNPSGTANYLVEAIDASIGKPITDVHGMRLPGVLATHTVIMSDETQKVEITHQSNNRYSFEEGVLLAMEKLDEIQDLVYGLEHILD